MALKPSQQTAQNYNLPPSVGGINALDSLAAMPPIDCVTSHNLMPSEYGMRLRAGYREWANGMNGKPVNTLIGFEGQAADQSSDRLFAVTEDGIWNVTTFGETAPVLEVDFFDINPVPPEGSGFGTFVEFTNDADERFLQYADEGYGLFQYAETGQAWTIPTFDPPADPPLLAPDIAFVTSWKNRLWYIKRNSGQSWYLEPDAQQGTATKFTFGSKLAHGGELLALFNWTIDGGEGIDDYLVAVGRGGDVLVYQGYDPATTATFDMKGSWFVGEFPESRRIAAEYGGELYLLSTYGVMSLRDLMQGVEITTTPTTPSSKINRFLRPAVEAGKDKRNWALHTYPGDGFLQIVAPYDEASLGTAIQYNQNLLTRAWGLWQNVPVNCAASWSGKYMIGDQQGRVWEYAGGADGRLLPNENLWDNTANGAEPPEWVQAPVGTFTCDGTQIADTSYNVDAVLADIGTNYRVTYTVANWVAGSCRLSFGGAETQPVAVDGTFTGVINAVSDGGSIAALIGDVDFQGEINTVQVREINPLEAGVSISFDVLTSFQPPGGDHTSNKRIGFIRPITIETTPSTLNTKAIYDYEISAEIQPPPPAAGAAQNAWDVAEWDIATWDYLLTSNSRTVGSLGMGNVAAIAMRGSANNRITFVGWDISWTQGGFL
jgi:hypothetical protein